MLRDLSLRDLLDLAESILVDSYGIAVIDEHLAALAAPPEPTPGVPQLAGWGEGAKAEQGQAAMMAMLGGT